MPHRFGFRLPLLAALVSIVALLGSTSPAPAAALAEPPQAPVTAPATTAPLPPPKAWILVDVESGRVIDAGNDHAALPPASLTKVVTALATSRLAPDTPVTVSDRAAAAPADKMFMKAGQVWTADQLMHTLLISSANDAAVALAEKVGGTLEGFGAVFARTASSLGMVDNPVLADPAGLDGPEGLAGGNLISARDLAIAGRALLAVPELATIAATPLYYFDGPDGVRHRLTNHNKLFLTSYTGAVGLKTGYTKRAGGCLMAAARVGDRTMLTVVLNSPNPALQAKQLLDKGFATPVASETVADRLPPVNLTSFGAAARDPGPGVAKPEPSASPGATPGGPSAARATPTGPASWRPGLVPAAAAAAVGLSVLWVVGRRRRRPRRLHRISGEGRSTTRGRRAA